MAQFSIPLSRCLVKFLLKITSKLPDSKICIVCLGYGGDYDLYTGLIYEDDKYLNPYDEGYEKFTLWVSY